MQSVPITTNEEKNTKTKYHNVGTIPKSNRKIVETARNVLT
jgi:hypothetical protein